MKQLDISVLNEFNTLVDSKVYIYLCDQLEELKTALITVDKEDNYRVIQGKAQMLFEIINLCDEAKQRIIDLRSSKIKSNPF